MLDFLRFWEHGLPSYAKLVPISNSCRTLSGCLTYLRFSFLICKMEKFTVAILKGLSIVTEVLCINSWHWIRISTEKYHTMLFLNNIAQPGQRNICQWGAYEIFFNWKFTSFDSFHPLCLPPTPALLTTTNIFSIPVAGLVCLFCLDSTYKRNHSVFVFLYLTYFTYPNTLKSYPCCHKGQDSILFMAEK